MVDIEKLIVILRDGRKIIGVLRSWDQFGNLVLQDSFERIFISAPHLPRVYADVPQGIFLVRGENTMMMGEIDLDKDDAVPPPWQLEDAGTVQRLHKEEVEMRKASDKRALGRLKSLGFEGEKSGEAEPECRRPIRTRRWWLCKIWCVQEDEEDESELQGESALFRVFRSWEKLMLMNKGISSQTYAARCIDKATFSSLRMETHC